MHDSSEGVSSSGSVLTISPLEDSYDIEGMHEAAAARNRLTMKIQEAFRQTEHANMALDAGACGVCQACTKQEGNPRRFPDLAVISLEACGIKCSRTCKNMQLTIYERTKHGNQFWITLI